MTANEFVEWWNQSHKRLHLQAKRGIVTRKEGERLFALAQSGEESDEYDEFIIVEDQYAPLPKAEIEPEIEEVKKWQL